MSGARSTRGYDRASIRAAFARVRVGFKFLGGPIDPSNASIFQMDIRQSRMGEYIRIWPGARGNVIRILGSDREFRQVVLYVQEARRAFTRPFFKSSTRTRAEAERRAIAEGGRLLYSAGPSWIIQFWTSEEPRRILCGMDDLHLFVVQVEEGDSVSQAHQSLRPEEVLEAESRWPNQILRQGEWFFLPLEESLQARLEEALKSDPFAILRAEPIGAGGKPHVAEELVRVRYRFRRRGREIREVEVFARGWIRHEDHRVLQLDGWRRVVRNRTAMPTQAEDPRLLWID